MRKHLFFNKARNCISIETGFLPLIQLGVDFGEDITFSFGFFFQLYLSFDFHKINSWLYQYGLHNRALMFSMWFSHGWSISVNIFSDTMSWKKNDWRWYINLRDILIGNPKCSQKTIEEKEILIPMPEKAYSGKATLADWTWTYPRWFPKTIRRCEIQIPEGIPFPGKGENPWDCGDDATFSITTGKVGSIAEAVGILVGDVLATRVRYGGWDCWNFKKED